MIILLAALLLLTIASYYLFKKDIICPAVLINLGFLGAGFCAYLYESEWGFFEKDFYVLVFYSILSFIAGCYIIYYITKKKKNNSINVTMKNDGLKYIDLKSSNLIVYSIIQIIFILLNIYEINVNVPFGSNIIEKIGIYYEFKRQGLLEYTVPVFNMFRIVNTSVVYFVIYVLVNNKILDRHINKFAIIVVFLGFVLAYLTGTRTEIFMYIFSGSIMYIILLRYKGRSIKINIKYVFLCIGILVLFNIFAILQGRTVQNMTLGDVFVTYLGAPLKNLELFINSRLTNYSIFGEATFNSTYQWLSITHTKIVGLYEYRFINGKGLGNVATLLTPLYYDFGLYGTIFAMFIIGMISQLFYNLIVFNKDKNIRYRTLIYSLVAFAITFSFFSNKFFEIVISRTMIYFIIGVYISNICFVRLKIN